MITQTSLQTTTFSRTGVETAQRIIVLVPDAELDLAYAARKIWEIATTVGGSIQFIGLCTDMYREPSLRRQMVALSAFMGTEKIPAQSRVEIGKNWLNALRTEWRQGDTIVCFNGVSAGISRKPLSQLLETSVEATIYVIDGAPRQAHGSQHGWWADALAWAGSIAIILGMFWLQTTITGLPSYWARTLLLCISIFVEFGMIWMWNSLFN